jgi:hypothetical protein
MYVMKIKSYLIIDLTKVREIMSLIGFQQE